VFRCTGPRYFANGINKTATTNGAYGVGFYTSRDPPTMVEYAMKSVGLASYIYEVKVMNPDKCYGENGERIYNSAKGTKEPKQAFLVEQIEDVNWWLFRGETDDLPGDDKGGFNADTCRLRMVKCWTWFDV